MDWPEGMGCEVASIAYGVCQLTCVRGDGDEKKSSSGSSSGSSSRSSREVEVV